MEFRSSTWKNHLSQNIIPHHQEDSNANFQNKQLWNAFANQYPLLVPPLAYQRRAKIELPKFDGNEKNSIAWLNKAEEYFEIYDINSDDEKIKHASMKMEGEAYNWYMWWKKTTLAISWTKFKDSFFKIFQGIKEEFFFQHSSNYAKKEMWMSTLENGRP